MKGLDFMSYLKEYEIIQDKVMNKTKKQFNNFLRVMYGKKKDRGHIKKEVQKYVQEQKINRAKLYNATLGAMPSLGAIGGPYSWI